ncbi:MAG TPA: Ppx/GppA phosphatase family protein [Candidatus Binatia bacterium]|nr:Ppx/GppA phosphatase family protein [Candidatus Binatia bacterium]
MRNRGRPTTEALRFAAIDIGTNTILLLIAEIPKKGSFKVLEDWAEITRLGEGVDRTGRIKPEAQARSIEVLKNYLRRCKDLRVSEISAVGTSALRDARNSEEFKARLKRQLGLDLRVLSGEEEAFYSYLAVQRGLAIEAADALVVDIGGGSTELIWGKRGKPQRAVSLNLGSVRLTERFLLSDPVREDEVQRLIATIDDALESSLDVRRSARHLRTLVGIAGTFTTLAAIEKGLSRYSHSQVHGCRLSHAEVRRQIALFEAKTVVERKAIPGLESKRADVILAGAVLIERIMAFFGAERVIVSDQGIRYGLLHERMSRQQG